MSTDDQINGYLRTILNLCYVALWEQGAETPTLVDAKRYLRSMLAKGPGPWPSAQDWQRDNFPFEQRSASALHKPLRGEMAGAIADGLILGLEEEQ